MNNTNPSTLNRGRIQETETAVDTRHRTETMDTRHRTETKIKKAQQTKKIDYTDPANKLEVNTCAREG